MKNILVPTDFSDCAHKACDFAIQLAAKADAHISFLHLQDTPVDWVKLPKNEESKFPETLHEIGLAKSQLSKMVKKAEDAGVYAEKTLIYSVGKEVVLNHLKNHDFDFMVMGSHGAKGLKEKLIGTNAQHMIRSAEVPVVVLKYPLEKEVRKIVFASDFSDISVESFAHVLNFSALFGAHLDLLYVDTPGHEKEHSTVDNNMKKLVEAIDASAGSIELHHIEADTVENGIQSFAMAHESDMIAICTHGKSGLTQLFKPSISEAVANHTHLPLLSIRL